MDVSASGRKSSIYDTIIAQRIFPTKHDSGRIGSETRRLPLHTIERVYAILSTTPQRWQQLLSTLPIDLLTRPPATGEWSALTCLQHLLDAEQYNFPTRFHAFFTGKDFDPFDPQSASLNPRLTNARATCCHIHTSTRSQPRPTPAGKRR